MASNRGKVRPSFEVLEARLALSGVTAAATGNPANGNVTPVIQPTPAAATNQTLVVLNEFQKAYQSHPGEANYNPALDLNHNNQIAMEDGKLLLRELPALSPKIPLKIYVSVAPADRVKGHHSTNEGGVTNTQTPTIIGHTTPGALLFTGTGTLDLKLRGPVVVADAEGNFSLKMKQTDGFNNLDFLAVDAYGQQTLLAFPMLWPGFGAYEAKHPKND